MAGLHLKIAISSGLQNTSQLLDALEAGEVSYDFVEVMACPGGCINGGGQPIQRDATRNSVPIRELRAKALYDEDASLDLRRSHDSPVIKTIYDEYFGSPNSEKAHHILHTKYTPRKLY